jgi:hypothetical protein
MFVVEVDVHKIRLPGVGAGDPDGDLRTVQFDVLPK